MQTVEFCLDVRCAMSSEANISPSDAEFHLKAVVSFFKGYTRGISLHNWVGVVNPERN